MTKSRKTTFEERVEIVKYCLKQDKAYKLTAKHYYLPYSQVYNWVKNTLNKEKKD